MFYDRKKYTLEHNGFIVEVEEPSNWFDDEREFVRHRDYHGITINLSDSMSFVGEGKLYLQSVVEEYGLNTTVKLTVDIKNPQTDIWEVDYIGWLDLLTFEVTETHFNCKLNADPHVALLKSKKTAKVELSRTTDLYGNEIGNLKVDTLYLTGRAILLSSKLSDYEAESGDLVFQAWKVEGIKKQPLFIKEYGEDLNAGVELVSSVLENTETNYSTKPSPNDTFINANNLGITVVYDIQLSIKQSLHYIIGNGATGGRVALELWLMDGDTSYNVKEVIPIWSTDGDIADLETELDITYSGEHTFLEGESAAFFWTNEVYGRRDDDYFGSSNRYGELYFSNTTKQNEETYRTYSVSVTEDSQREPTTSKTILAYEYAERLNKIILGIDFKSELLSRPDINGYDDYGSMGQTSFSHGMWLRGQESGIDTFKELSTSFSSFYESLNVVYPIGLSVDNGVMTLEDRDYFYQKYVSIKLGEVDDLIISADEESYVSLINVGYKRSGGYNEETQGLDEYNRETQYNTAIINTDNELDLVSDYRADGYGMETVRRENPSINKAANIDDDSRFDDEIWIFDVKLPSGQTNWELKAWEERFEYAPKQVYSADTVVNLWYSPINLLLRHGSYIKPPLLKELDTMIGFNSSEGNADIITQQIDGKEYQQNIGIPVEDLERSANKAMLATFRAPVTYEQLNGNTFNKPNVYGLCEFTRYGVTYKGYILNAKLLHGIGTFEVLLYTSITATSSYVEPPTPPVIGILSIDDVGVSNVDLSWTEATDDVGVVNYKVYISTDGVSFDLGKGVGNVLTYSYIGLEVSTQYWFKITALDALGAESDFSNIVNDTTGPLPLQIPTGITLREI